MKPLFFLLAGTLILVSCSKPNPQQTIPGAAKTDFNQLEISPGFDWSSSIKGQLNVRIDNGFSHNLDTYSSYVEELKHFLKCVKHRKETINNLEQGIATLKIALAIKKASKLMKSVNV